MADEPAPVPPAPPGPPAPPLPHEVAPPLPVAEDVLPQGPMDLLEFLATLDTQISRLQVPPGKTSTDHALFDAWRSILEPRAARMAGRMRRIAEPKRWMLAGDGSTRILAVDAWDAVVREAAALYTELAGALEQYTNVRINFVRPSSGFGLQGPEPGPPDPDAPGRALARLEAQEQALAFKVAAGQVLWQDELQTYWSMVRHAQHEVARYEQDLARWNAQVAAFQDLQARIHFGLAFQRQTLALQMFALRALTAALQAAEEDRLRLLVGALPEQHARRLEAGTLLADLRTARNAAENHRGATSSGWGATLRARWLGPRMRLLALLEQAFQPPR